MRILSNIFCWNLLAARSEKGCEKCFYLVWYKVRIGEPGGTPLPRVWKQELFDYGVKPPIHRLILQELRLLCQAPASPPPPPSPRENGLAREPEPLFSHTPPMKGVHRQWRYSLTLQAPISTIKFSKLKFIHFLKESAESICLQIKAVSFEWSLY